MLVAEISGKIGYSGALLTSNVKPSKIRDRYFRFGPEQVTGAFLADTGSSNTYIDRSFLAPLEIEEFDVQSPSNFAGATVDVGLALVTLELHANNGLLRPVVNLRVYLTDFAEGNPFLGVLGRDVLNRGKFAYHGTESRFSFVY